MLRTKSRLRRSFITFPSLAATGALVGGALVSQASPAAAADQNGCDANVQNPHYSSSHGGYDVTVTYKCDTINRDIQALAILWKCQTTPPIINGIPDKGWLANNCDFWDNNRDFSVTKKNYQYPITAPAPTDPAAGGSGYYVGETTWRSYSYENNWTDYKTQFGNVVYLP